MKVTTGLQAAMTAIPPSSSASASSDGDFIGIAFWVFAAYCAFVLGPHTMRAIRSLWREAQEQRQAKRERSADS